MTWWSSATFAQYLCTETYVPRQTNFKNYYHPQSDIIYVSLNCLWFVHSLKMRELSCIAFLALSCFVREGRILLLLLVGKHKIPKRLTPIVWRAGTKYILSVFADWVLCKILISSLILINFFIYLNAILVVQLSGWLVSRVCNYRKHEDFDPCFFQLNFHPLTINEECANKLFEFTAGFDACRPDVLKQETDLIPVISKERPLLTFMVFHQPLKQLYLDELGNAFLLILI